MDDIKRKDLFGKTYEIILVLLRGPKGLKSTPHNTLTVVMIKTGPEETTHMKRVDYYTRGRENVNL